MKNQNQKEPLATRKDAAQFFKISERSIDRMRASGKLKFIKIGKQVRFNWNDLKRITQ